MNADKLAYCIHGIKEKKANSFNNKLKTKANTILNRYRINLIFPSREAAFLLPICTFKLKHSTNIDRQDGSAVNPINP